MHSMRKSTKRGFVSLLPAVAAAALALVSGCATWDCRFKPKTTVWFINDYNDVVKVDYADEVRETTLYREDGTEVAYKSSYKTRVTFPSGYRFVAYDVPSGGGRLYRSDDGEGELLVVGYACRIYQFFEDGSEIAFEGMICSQSGGGMSRGDRKRGHDVFRTSREHADIHAQPKKVKSK